LIAARKVSDFGKDGGHPNIQGCGGFAASAELNLIIY